MKACLDVQYTEDAAVAACLLFRGWTDAHAAESFVETIGDVKPYQPGEFYRRELPCLLAVLARINPAPDTILIDGYVWLGPDRRPGLGMHLYEVLGGSVPIVGVAKTAFAGTPAVPVMRGGSARPLWVTAAGMDEAEAAGHVANMAGDHRLPFLLKQVDRLCRSSPAKI